MGERTLFGDVRGTWTVTCKLIEKASWALRGGNITKMLQCGLKYNCLQAEIFQEIVRECEAIERRSSPSNSSSSSPIYVRKHLTPILSFSFSSPGPPRMSTKLQTLLVHSVILLGRRERRYSCPVLRFCYLLLLGPKPPCSHSI